MDTLSRTVPTPPRVRCYTRALKNARYLQQEAPHLFAKNPQAEGFGTGVAVEILRGLHRLRCDSPVLSRHQAVADFLRAKRLPVPALDVSGALFSGTVHFAQVTFQTSGGDIMIGIDDMHQLVEYARHAIVPISSYAAQYGPNTVDISPTLLTYNASVPTGRCSDGDLKRWVNQMVSANSLPSNSCIFVAYPRGLYADNVGSNVGYHGKADVPYIAAGVFATGLTLADSADIYAMVVSHEIAEMIVDPDANLANPEVCDPCDGNCNNLTRCYFDAADGFLGSSNRVSPPSRFNFSYYTCAVVKPAAPKDCNASSSDCAYAPPP